MHATIKATNLKSYFIGEITSDEAETAHYDNPEIDGFGFYLVEVDNTAPMAPGNVIAKFVDEAAAKAVASVFRARGLLES